MRQGCNSDGEPYDFFVVHEPVDLECEDDGMTRQEFKDECDINVLMAGYERHGVISHVNPRAPAYFDATEVPDLAGALAMVDAAQKAFMQLPAAARKTFDNDPVKFVEFASDPANVSQLREWGLAEPEKVASASNAAPGTSTPSGSQNPPAAS